MHVVRIKSRHTDRQGRERVYESRLLRRTWRDGGTVRNQTLANLSKMPDRIVDAVEAALKGEVLVPAGEAAVSIARSLPHGHVAAVHAMARALGLPALLGPAGRQRDLALAMIVSRVVAPGSKLSTLAWWGVTDAEGLAGWEALRAWKDGAAQPDVAALQEQCLALVASGVVGGECRFDPDAVIAPFDSIVRPRPAEALLRGHSLRPLPPGYVPPWVGAAKTFER